MVLASDWVNAFTNLEIGLSLLRKDYGDGYSQIESKRKIILELLNLHIQKFGNEDIIIVRVPGRINLMGRHIDHQGGHVNLIAIDKEIFITASKRSDFSIKAFNTQHARFPSVSIDFKNIGINLNANWVDLVNDTDLLHRLRSPNGHWENYIKSTFYRLQHIKGKPIFGANICVSGTIPIAAGVSSSSALTVGMFLVMMHLNGYNFDSQKIIEFSGEAEWFSGTRGGISDQTAIILGKMNKIMHAKFFTLEIIEYIPFPKPLEILLCNTKIKADKSGEKKDLFNEKVLVYDIGFKLFLKTFPQFSDKLNRLRDINPSNLGISSISLMTKLFKIPEYVNIENVDKTMNSLIENEMKKFEFKDAPKFIPIRKVLAYGITECERSKRFIEAIKSTDLYKLGKLLNASHDGDRVVDYSNLSNPTSYDNELTDTKIHTYIENKRILPEISGGYGCSIPEIDFLIDLSKTINGVVGAQLSGAGLGGSCMIFVQKRLSLEIKQELKKDYYKHFNKHCEILPISAVNGSRVYIDL